MLVDSKILGQTEHGSILSLKEDITRKWKNVGFVSAHNLELTVACVILFIVDDPLWELGNIEEPP